MERGPGCMSPWIRTSMVRFAAGGKGEVIEGVTGIRE